MREEGAHARAQYLGTGSVVLKETPVEYRKSKRRMTKEAQS